MFEVTTRQSDQSIAKQYVNNWRKFPDFGMFDETIRDSDNYTLVYTQNRDSDPLARSNAEYVDSQLEQYADLTVTTPAGDTEPMLITASCSHWACGWISGYAIAVYDTATESGLSSAFEAMCEISRDYANYPALNEDRWSELESDEDWQMLEDEAGYLSRHTDIEYTADMLYTALQDLDIDRWGYGYYGEAYIKQEDLELAAAYAALDTYRDQPCSD